MLPTTQQPDFEPTHQRQDRDPAGSEGATKSSFPKDAVRQSYPEPWRESQAHRYSAIDPVPTAWLKRLANPFPRPTASLTTGEKRISLDDFARVLCEEGVREPLLIRLCLESGWGRLEGGNHRCHLAAAAGIEYLPASVMLGRGPIWYDFNGFHVFDLRDDLIPALKKPEEIFECWTAPSQVFRSIRAMKEAGALDLSGRYPKYEGDWRPV